jgi:hypothetical protein
MATRNPNQAVATSTALFLAMSVGLVFTGWIYLRHHGRNIVAEGDRIGQVAPDISGVDIQGLPLKLSDYRGKVVVLDFWGNW